MLKNTALAVILLIVTSSLALAQTTGSQALSEPQVMSKLQSEGYSNIKLAPEPTRPSTNGETGQSGGTGSTSGSGSSVSPRGGHSAQEMWTGTAMKGGKQVNIQVDSSGKVNVVK